VPRWRCSAGRAAIWASRSLSITRSRHSPPAHSAGSFWGLVLVPMFFLIAIWGGAGRKAAAVKYFLYTMAGSVPLLLAMFLLYFAGPTNGTLVPGSGNRYNGLVRPGEVPDDQVENVPNADSDAVNAIPIADTRGIYQPQSVFMPRFSFAWSPGGNGKTSIARSIGDFMNNAGGEIYVPHAFLAENAIITLYDEAVHQPVENDASDRVEDNEATIRRLLNTGTVDPRWVRIRRPVVVTGGAGLVDPEAHCPILRGPRCRTVTAPRRWSDGAVGAPAVRPSHPPSDSEGGESQRSAAG